MATIKRQPKTEEKVSSVEQKATVTPRKRKPAEVAMVTEPVKTVLKKGGKKTEPAPVVEEKKGSNAKVATSAVAMEREEAKKAVVTTPKPDAPAPTKKGGEKAKPAPTTRVELADTFTAGNLTYTIVKGVKDIEALQKLVMENPFRVRVLLEEDRYKNSKGELTPTNLALMYMTPNMVFLCDLTQSKSETYESVMTLFPENLVGRSKTIDFADVGKLKYYIYLISPKVATKK